jgi:hypothetical protein
MGCGPGEGGQQARRYDRGEKSASDHIFIVASWPDRPGKKITRQGAQPILTNVAT